MRFSNIKGLYVHQNIKHAKSVDTDLFALNSSTNLKLKTELPIKSWVASPY